MCSILVGPGWIDPLDRRGEEVGFGLRRASATRSRVAVGKRQHRSSSIPSWSRRSWSRLVAFARSVRRWPIDQRAEAARLIARVGPGHLNKVFFTNGGGRRPKTPFAWLATHTAPQGAVRLSLYHGSTTGAISLPASPAVGQRGRPRPAWCTSWVRISTDRRSSSENESEELHARSVHLERSSPTKVRPNIAAIIMEPVPRQCWEYWCRLGLPARRCARFVIDTASCSSPTEVMCGFGRIGKWFARRRVVG